MAASASNAELASSRFSRRFLALQGKDELIAVGVFDAKAWIAPPHVLSRDRPLRDFLVEGGQLFRFQRNEQTSGCSAVWVQAENHLTIAANDLGDEGLSVLLVRPRSFEGKDVEVEGNRRGHVTDEEDRARVPTGHSEVGVE